MSHTYNGEPVLACGHTESEHRLTGGTIWCVSAIEAEKMATTPAQYGRVGFPAPKADVLRAALRDALQIIDEERAGTKSGYSREDVERLEKIRALAGED